MSHLSHTMRTAIRNIKDGHPEHVSSRTMGALENRRMVTTTAPGAYPILTPLGERTYTEIMRSGDGPEDLKERFSFLTPRRR